MRRPIGPVLLATPHQTQTTPSSPAATARQPAAAHPSSRSPRPEIGRTNAPFARKASNTCQNSRGTRECTRGRNPSNVTRATKPSASRHTCSTISERTATSARSSVPFVRRVLSTAPTWCATCTCTLVSTCSNATYVSCTSKSRPSSSTTPATRRARARSAAPHAVRVSSGRPTFANTSVRTPRSGPSTVTSVR